MNRLGRRVVLREPVHVGGVKDILDECARIAVQDEGIEVPRPKLYLNSVNSRYNGTAKLLEHISDLTR